MTEPQHDDYRTQIAADRGLPADIAATLSGTPEEVTAHADRLIAWRDAPRTPRPDPGQGPRPDGVIDPFETEYRRYFPKDVR